MTRSPFAPRVKGYTNARSASPYTQIHLQLNLRLLCGMQTIQRLPTNMTAFRSQA